MKKTGLLKKVLSLTSELISLKLKKSNTEEEILKDIERSNDILSELLKIKDSIK